MAINMTAAQRSSGEAQFNCNKVCKIVHGNDCKAKRINASAAHMQRATRSRPPEVAAHERDWNKVHRHGLAALSASSIAPQL